MSDWRLCSRSRRNACSHEYTRSSVKEHFPFYVRIKLGTRQSGCDAHTITRKYDSCERCSPCHYFGHCCEVMLAKLLGQRVLVFKTGYFCLDLPLFLRNKCKILCSYFILCVHSNAGVDRIMSYGLFVSKEFAINQIELIQSSTFCSHYTACSGFLQSPYL